MSSGRAGGGGDGGPGAPDSGSNSSSVVSLVQQLKAGKMSKEELFDQLSRQATSDRAHHALTNSESSLIPTDSISLHVLQTLVALDPWRGRGTTPVPQPQPGQGELVGPLLGFKLPLAARPLGGMVCMPLGGPCHQHPEGPTPFTVVHAEIRSRIFSSWSRHLISMISWWCWHAGCMHAS